MSRKKGLTDEQIRQRLLATSLSDSEGESFDGDDSNDEFIPANETVSSDSEDDIDNVQETNIEETPGKQNLSFMNTSRLGIISCVYIFQFHYIMPKIL